MSIVTNARETVNDFRAAEVQALQFDVVCRTGDQRPFLVMKWNGLSVVIAHPVKAVGEIRGGRWIYKVGSVSLLALDHVRRFEHIHGLADGANANAILSGEFFLIRKAPIWIEGCRDAHGQKIVNLLKKWPTPQWLRN